MTAHRNSGKGRTPSRATRKRRKPAAKHAGRVPAGPSSRTRRLERSLRETEQRYALASQAIAEGIYDWNIEHNTLFVSPRLMEIFDFKGALTSQDWYHRVHPGDMEPYRTALTECFRGDTSKVECQYRIKAADGTYRWIEDHGLPVRNKAGRAGRLVGAVADITRRREMEQALRESEERYALAMQAVNEGVYDWNLVTGEIYYSPGVGNSLGIAQEELRTPKDWLDRIHPDDIAGYRQALVDHFKGGTSRLVCEYRYRHPDGGWHWARQHGLALRDEQGRACRVAGSTGDITAEKAALTDLKRAQDRLVHAERLASLGRLTAGVAHEIKNPLNFVNNFADLSTDLMGELAQSVDAMLAQPTGQMRDDIADTMSLLKSNLTKIAEHGRRADGIVRSMLAHSRGGSADWKMSDMNALAGEALNLAFHGARAQDPDFNVTIERDFDAAAKAIEVMPQEMTRVLLNLFGNGFYAARQRHRAEGGAGRPPTVRVATRDLGEAVEVRVRDNGIGIPAEVRDKLFQPFFTTKPTGEGTGLGLSISYDIVTQQHGGTIDVESEVGSFTEFTVRLPRIARVASAKAKRA
jgi:PAS domain S-box-containing protein